MTDLTHRDDAETVAIEATREGGPVDPPPHPTTFADITEDRHLRPIVPASLRSAAGRRSLVVDTGRLAGYYAAYHVWHMPVYLARMAKWAPRGLVRAFYLPGKWASAEEGNWNLRQQAANRDDYGAWLQLDARRMKQATWRWPLVLTLGFAVAVSGAVFANVAPGGKWSLVAALFLLAGWLGRPADKPIIDRVTTGGRFIRLTAELTRAALVASGAGIKDGGQVSFNREIYRDGPGHTALVSLPSGVIATDVVDKREYLAAGFRLPVDQVWPDPVDGEHPGVLSIWVADKPVSAMKQPAWPLLEDGITDFFGELPYGFDPRLRPVSWVLAERNSLFGGVPGSGKTLAARTVALGAVLDPLVVPLVSELKGSGDLDAFEPLCPEGMYVSGADERSLHRTMAILEFLLQECETRGPLIKGWVARGYGVDNKLNRRIAEADPRLRPLLGIFDEIQELITHPELGKAAAAMLTSIVKRGRSLGIHLILSTQRIDKESVPKAISSNIVNRVALAVTSHIETDLILGTGAYSRGARPTSFRPGRDAGWAYLTGMVAPVRAAYLNNEDAKRICARAIEMRAGLVGPQAERVRSYNLAEDARAVWPAGQTGVWLADLLQLLQGLRPDVYGELDAVALGAALRAASVEVVKLHRKIEGKGHTRPGVRIEAVTAAIDAADPTIGAIGR
ncbi:cell division protein FtsK [Micromonospora sp. NPDC048839]|uniref:cell division protein FtsK n=1 Tax=Micromonospora sp. NPDC048839 TaxID=3155641 RepID=UPI00340629EB